MIVPDNGYKLVYDDGKEDFEISGFVIVNVNRISSFGDYKVLEDIEEEADRGETDVSDI